MRPSTLSFSARLLAQRARGGEGEREGEREGQGDRDCVFRVCICCDFVYIGVHDFKALSSTFLTKLL